jgi:RNA polymerase sigma factor (sigma-70 family)
MVARQRSALVRFARYLDANAPADVVHDTVERLISAGAYERYAAEPEAARIPTWLRKALKLTILATRAKGQRRERLLREDLAEKAHIGEAIVSDGAAKEEKTAEGGFEVRREQELGVRQEDGLGRLVRVEEELEREALHEALAAELAKIEPTTATGIRLVLGDGQSWDQASKVTGVPAEALRKRVARAKVTIRENLVRSDDLAHVVVRGQENDLPAEKS